MTSYLDEGGHVKVKGPKYFDGQMLPGISTYLDDTLLYADGRGLSEASIVRARNIFIPANQLTAPEMAERTAYLQGYEKEKTGVGKIFHDVGATVLKAVVQPFKSFSDEKKYDKIFNPKMQTGAFKTLHKGVDKLDDLGHSVGQSYVGSKTGSAVSFQTDAQGNSKGAKADVKKLAAQYGGQVAGAISNTGVAGQLGETQLGGAAEEAYGQVQSAGAQLGNTTLNNGNMNVSQLLEQGQGMLNTPEGQAFQTTAIDQASTVFKKKKKKKNKNASIGSGQVDPTYQMGAGAAMDAGQGEHKNKKKKKEKIKKEKALKDGQVFVFPLGWRKYTY